MTVLRCFHPGPLQRGLLELDATESHHLLRVRRAALGEPIECLDGKGHRALARLSAVEKDRALIEIDSVSSEMPPPELTVASPVPRANRGDWLIEKLSEIGVTRFIPLLTERGRSRTTADSSGRRDRWLRLAIAALKQSGRSRMLEIGPVQGIEEVLEQQSVATVYAASLSPVALPILTALERHGVGPPVLALIGPEGGTTPPEEKMLARHGAVSVRLAAHVLRVETAALLLAAALTQSLAGASTRGSAP